MKRIAGVVIVLWALGVVFLVPDLYSAFGAASAAGSGSFIMQLMGEGKSIVSNLSLLEADRYYHGGLGHDDDHFEAGSMHADAEPDHDEEADDEHESIAGRIGPYNVLFALSNDIEITDHTHLSGDQEKEIVPWLYYAVKADPHNVMAVTLAAYYLSDRFGKVDQALELLQEGRRNNPTSWEIYAEIGKIYFLNFKDYEDAVFYLSRSRELINEVPHDRFQERYVLTLLALSYEKKGMPGKALEAYERLNELFPESKTIPARINELKGEPS